MKKMREKTKRIGNYSSKMLLERRSAGFTFIELMAVIAIISIMAVVVAFSMSSPKTVMALKTAQDSLASDIKLVQSYALQGRIPIGITGMCGYGLQFTTNSSYNVFYYTKNGAACDPAVNRTIVNTVALKSNVILSGPPLANTYVIANIPNGNLVMASGSQTFTFSLSSQTRTVTINSVGLVTEN